MKINISRQYIYLMGVSILLFVFVLLFSFLVLIPEGKEYRENRGELKLKSNDLRKYQNLSDEMEAKLKELQKKHRHVIVAFDTQFTPSRFKEQHKNNFSSLDISKAEIIEDTEGFVTYEVNTTSKISSPKSFYDFLDAINKSDWIIGVNFPIDFKRDGELINSSFTMKVYCNAKDKNATKKEEK